MKAISRARIALLVTVVVWAWSFVAAKVCLEQLRPFEILGLRFLIALPALWIMLHLRGAALTVPAKERRVLAGVWVATGR
ncbi:MAG: EamA family transporter [bacterium]|nr:EamA family transporter [bacterium]